MEYSSRTRRYPCKGVNLALSPYSFRASLQDFAESRCGKVCSSAFIFSLRGIETFAEQLVATICLASTPRNMQRCLPLRIKAQVRFVFVVNVCVLMIGRSPPPHSSICHAYSRSLRSLAAFLAANHFFSNPFDRSTPSHLQPGRIPYRFGSAAPI